jgi:glycine/D-amino acid oxidase-like deaminating enzyme
VRAQRDRVIATAGHVLDQGDVLWAREAPISTAPIEPLPAEADVVVVGSGYTGVAAARELARRGREVLVLEQGAIGAGASTRNAGFAHAGVRRSLPELRRRFGDALGRELYRDTVAALDHVGAIVDEARIDCDLERRGYLYLAQRPRRARRLRDAQAALAEAGHQATLLGPADVGREAGTDGYAGGLLLDDAASLHPARFLAGLVADAGRRGARLSAHTPVTALRPRAAGGVEVSTPRGVVRAGHVLVATDGYTAGLLPFLRRRIIPIDSFLLATEPLSAELQRQVSPRGHLCLETKNFLCYWRVSRDGRLVFGGRASFAPTSVERAAAWLQERLGRAYPVLADTPVAAAWGGKTGFSFDQLPHVGRVGDITYAVAYCGGGVALATWFGTRSAAWIDGEPAPPFARIPFPVVPLFSGRPWFLPIVGLAFGLQDALA